MQKFTLNKRQKVLFILLIILFSWWLVSLIFIKGLGLRINLTESIPIGVYKLNTNSIVKKGDYVEFCLNKRESEIAYMKSYIGTGSCWGKYEALAKRVIAEPKDDVTVTRDYIEINGNKYNQYKQKVYSQYGEKANLISYKNKILKGYFMVGDSDIVNSWDSRYYGQIPSSNIRGVLTPIWTW
jgi:conjugative transfer signal peptidase TraF